MKRTLAFLFIGSCVAFLSKADASTVWRQQGATIAYGTNTTQTTIYINGDMHFASGNDQSQNPEMIVENSRIKLTGDFINDVDRTTGGTLFVSPASGNFGVFEFCGINAQQITTTGSTILTIPSKQSNYINFPGIDINNENHVTLDARLAAKAQNISLSKGWLILDSDIAKINIDGDYEVDESQESVLAHLLVDGTIDYMESTWQDKEANERGFIQVNLKVPGEGSQAAKSIVGLGIPFQEMYNDYFMFNTLLEPQPGYSSGEGFLSRAPITDPKTKLFAGKGYVVGIDLRGTDPAEYGALEEYADIVDFNQRATDGYRFNRHAFASYADKNQLFGTNPSQEAYQIEKLNTEDITVNLIPGYNYLSNPYTCPLNIDKLLGNDEARGTWGIQADALSAKPQMRNQVWVLAPNSVAEPTEDSRKSKYTYNYQVAMKAGGTYIDTDNTPGVTAIAPLQMFLVRSYSTASSITIPKEERVMGTTRFLRSAPLENKRRDDFIIEFRDKITNTTDRASIVLRTQGELVNNSNYANVERIKSTSGESGNGTRSTMAISDFEQNLASQIYTKDAQNKPLTVQFLPVETTNRIILYHIPSTKAQPLHIFGLRLNTKDKVQSMWLEDRKYNTQVEITPDMLYETYSEPTDSHERFVLRFSQDTNGIGDENENESLMYAYTENKNIYAAGFTDRDFGNSISLFDINGRLIIQKRANEPKLLLQENYTAGVYIIRIDSEKPKTIKLIAK